MQCSPVTIFTVMYDLSSRKKSTTMVTVATIDMMEPGAVPSVKSFGTLRKKSNCLRLMVTRARGRNTAT